MILPVVPSPMADGDLIEIMYYLSTQSPSLGDRFARAVEKTYQQLSKIPCLGELCPSKDPSMQNIRIWRVKGFSESSDFLPRRTGTNCRGPFETCRNERQGSF